MKNSSRSLALFIGLCLVSVLASAKECANTPAKANSRSVQQTQVGDCSASTSEFDIDINNVRAMLLGGGDLWWNFSLPEYNVPKSTGSAPPVCAIFAGAIWITGFDAGQNLKCAAVRYRQNGNDYWPGPLTNGQVDAATCAQYDMHFSVLGTNIALAQTAFLQKGSLTTTGDIPKDVLAWPAIGNQYLASDPTLVGQTFNITDNLAPFEDFDGNGIYDPVKGDYPDIPCRNSQTHAYGDQMVFWVFNDVGNIHTESNGEAIGVQVNALAFAFQSTDAINNMTFYNYEIINKSSNKLFNTYVSQWVDPDLGCFDNDRVGCDTTRALGICYNGTTPDPDCGNEYGYQSDLPIVGVDFFQGPLSDSGAEIGLSSFVYFTNGADFSQQDPSSAAQYRNYQTGFWNDGTPFTEGGTGYNSGGPATKFIFPGNPAISNQWSECQVAKQLPPGDRRFVQSSGAFTLTPGISQFVTVGVVFVQPPGTGVGLCPDYTQNIDPADDEAQNLFNTCFQLLSGPDAPTLQIRELNNEVIINLVNLPGSNNVGENYTQVDGATASAVDQTLGGHGDSTYRFQGYKLYQVVNPTVSATNLTDATQAALIAEVDIKDGVSNIINFIKDPNLGLYVPVLEVAGHDAGVTNSFDITTDAFATGTNTQLINQTIYYFTAVAFAYNNYQQYNQADPQAGGQLTPYLQGRGNFNVYSAIPHITNPRNVGTVLNSKWGSGVQVNRIEGQGNGGNVLFLTDQSVQSILNSGTYAFVDTLSYKPTADPIGFKVTDPINLKEAEFELQFLDTPSNTDPIGKKTFWILHDLTNNDTIWSDRTLDRPYEQQIAANTPAGRIDYGFSLDLGTPANVYTIPGSYLALANAPNRYVYGMSVDASGNTQSTDTFADATQPWLSFLPSSGTNAPSNWIRSGTTLNAPCGNTPSPYAGVYDANWYYLTSNGSPTGDGDGSPPTWNTANQGCVAPTVIFTDSNDIFNSIIGGTWAPYCLSANYANKNATGGAPPYVYGPGFKWKNYSGSSAPPQNTLDRIASVDIVITPDKSKWSKCVVFETGEDEGVNAGNDVYQRSKYDPSLEGKGALKGQIRMAYSMDWNNPATRDYLVSQNPNNSAILNGDTGRSWFPGYAINVETGARLNIAFGESSSNADQNGDDMLWDPTANIYSPLNQPYFGGKHFIYVMDSKYDEGAAAQQLLLRTYDSISAVQGGTIPVSLYPLYRSLMWTSIPYLTAGYNFAPDPNGLAYIPPVELITHLRVQKPFDRLATISSSGIDSTLPRYQFSTKGLGATDNNETVAKNALDLIKIVPNPYLGYSSYETGASAGVVYITNLPNICTITIYTLNGVVVNTLSQSLGIDPSTNQQIETSAGVNVNEVNPVNTLTWNLTNDKLVPVASGIYLFHIEAPGLGERTLKWFGAIRPNDITDY